VVSKISVERWGRYIGFELERRLRMRPAAIRATTGIGAGEGTGGPSLRTRSGILNGLLECSQRLLQKLRKEGDTRSCS